MLPVIWPGDMLLVYRAPFADLECGDLLLHLGESKLGLHRIVEKTANSVTVRGDLFAKGSVCVPPSLALGKLALIQRGRSRIAPKRELSPVQKVLLLFVRRCKPLRAVMVRLNSLRLLLTS